MLSRVVAPAIVAFPVEEAALACARTSGLVFRDRRGLGRWTKPLYKDFPSRLELNLVFRSFLIHGMTGQAKLRSDREQTAHLQTALLRPEARTQIRTAQPGSIRATWLGTIAAASGLSSSPAAGLTCQCIFESTSLVEGIDS